MRNRFVKPVKGFLALISMLPGVAAALNTTVTLTADGTITPNASEVVTFGLPLLQGDVATTNLIRVSIGGVEQSIYVEAGLMWHFGDNTLRSVTIQMQGVNMTGGDITLTITDAGRNTANDLTEVAHSNGWATGPANKASMPFPRIFAKHDLTYLASTGIIPSYIPGTALEGVGKLQSDQFNNGFGGLDFSINGPGAQSSFLFDRASAMMKAYMTTGDVKFLKEGFLTKQLYFTHIKNNGTVATSNFVTGGDGCFTFGDTGCSDGKYVYTQPAKLAWALFGDNSQWDNSLINEMAAIADIGSWQPNTRDPYDVESEAFTERAAGIIGLAEIGAYEITGSATVLSNLNERINVLKDMQQTTKTWETTNSWAKSGAFTHSWANHEGDTYPGDGTANDRRFSPWMSENIADFLWQTYNITARADIPEMLRQLGNAIDLHGFTSSYVSGSGLASTYSTKPGLTTINMSCTAPDNVPVSILYSASNVASAAALATTASAQGGFADQHNVETVLPLALAFYFETDSAARTRLFSRIKHIERQWLNNGPTDPENCSLIFTTGTYRMFSWQHRSNSMRTWNWALNEVAGVFDDVPNAFTFTNQTNLDPATPVTSSAVTIAGMGTGAVASVTTTAGTLVINGADCTSSCQVDNGDTLAVRITTSGSSLGTASATVSVGAVSSTFTATTKVVTLTYTGHVLVHSETGCNNGNIWHFECGAADQWVPAASFASHDLIATCGLPDGTTCLNVGSSRRWSSVSSLTVNTFVLNCTSVPPDLNSRTSCPAANTTLIKSGGIVAVDDTPSAFPYTALTNQSPSTLVLSNAVTLAGMGSGVNATATTTLGILVKNGSDCAAPCTVVNGNTLAVKVTTSASFSTAVTATVAIGNTSSIFSATTSAPPGTTPDPFGFTTQIGQTTNSLITSNAVTIAGLGSGVNASATTTSGSLIKNGVVCGAPCTVANGNTLASRVTSSATSATSVAATVTVGTYSTSFTVVTAGAAGQLLFLNVTPSLVNMAPRVTQHFWAGLPDVNGDGCFDLFTGTHADELADSALMLHNRTNSGCAGTFTYMDTTTSNYTQPTAAPRITSRYLWGNWYGHTQGLWSFLGQDVDGGASARYVISNATTSGAIPQYDTKTIGCNGSQMFCLPIEIDGDGVIEIASRLRNYTTPNMGYILNAATGAVKFTPTVDAAGSAYGNAHAVLDLDNDGYPEIVQPTNRGYWKYNPVGGAITWQANKFPATVPGTLAAGNHLVPIDYDSDGDMDLYFGVGTYSADNNAVLHAIKRDNIFDVYFYRNNGDGTFTDVTVAADLGAANLLKNTYFHSTYSNTVAADINLDGFPDLVYGGESAGHTATATRVTMLMNNGNGTFTVNRSNNFGTYVDSPNFQGRPWVNSADYDNDGLLDIVKTAGISGPNHESIALYRNVTNTSGNDWLRVRVRGFGNNTDGLHTRLVFRDVGTNAIITSYQIGAFTTGYVNMIPHAGLGNRATVKLEVFYPHGGPSYTFNNLSTNQDVVVFHNGTLLQNYIPGSKIPLTPAEAGTYTGTVIAPLIADPSMDTTPNSFTYTNLIDQTNSTVVTSNTLGIAGLGSGVSASASTTLGSLVKNGSACGAPCTVVNGDTLAVSVTTSATAGVTVSATVTVGTYSTTFNATTTPLAADTTPDAFTYTAQTLLELNTQVTSNAVSIAGLGAGVSANATTNIGQLIKNGVVCAAPCTVVNGNTLAVRVTTAALPETSVTATVTVGTVSTTFSATTFLLDTPPGSLTFTAVTGAELTNAYDSNGITVGWLGAATAVSTNNGTLLINGSPCASGCTVSYGNTLAVRLVSSGSASTLVSATVTVNGISGTFNVTTGAGGGGGGADTTPDAFTFTAQTGLAPSTAVTSNAITVAGLGAAVNAVVTTSAGSLLKNGTACGGACTAANGDTIAVNLTTSASGLTAVTATVTIGTGNAVFSATTLALGSVPGSLSFTAVTGANLSLTYDSNSITVNWIGVQTTVSISNGLLLKNGSLCGDPCSVNFGDQLAVRLTASDIASTLISANVSIGAVNGAFNVTTGAGGGGGGGDITPDAFAFTAQPSVNPSTLVTSNAITVAGLGTGVNASVTTTLGSLVKNGVACAGPCTVVNGNTLAVSVTSAATGLTAVNATVTIGTVNAGFSATTVALGPTPGSLNFIPVTGAELNQSYSSNGITVNWIGVPTAVSTTSGVLLKNGNTCTAPCSIAFGNQLGIQLTSSGTANTLVSATVTIGGVSGTFNVTTGVATSSGGGGGGGSSGGGTGGGGSGGDSTSTLILGDSPNLEIQPGQQITNQGTLINPINNGTVNGGNVSGNVNNSGTGVLNNVTLVSGTTVTGGSISGVLGGTGTVQNAVVNVLEVSPGITIGTGSKVTTTTVNNVAGLVLTGALTDATGNLQMDQPLLINPDGTESSILDINKAAIDKLLGNQNTAVTNSTGDGGVVITNSDVSGVVIPVTPTSVVTTNAPDSISTVNSSGELVIVSNGIKTTFTPSASDLAAFQAGIDANGGDTNLLENGLVFIEFSGGTFSVRFSLVATTPQNSAISGLVSIAAISLGEAEFSESGTLANPASYRIIVKYPDGTRQTLLPAIHNVVAFQSWLSAFGMNAIIDGVDGTLQILDSNKAVIWRGIAAYTLSPLPTGNLASVRITSTPDLNGDGIADMYFDSLTHRQAIYVLPLQ